MIEPDFDKDERCSKCYRPLARDKTTTTTNTVIEVFDPKHGDWKKDNDNYQNYSDYEQEYPVYDNERCSYCDNDPKKCKCDPLKYETKINVHGKEEFVKFEDE